MWGISLLAGKLSDSQYGFCFIHFLGCYIGWLVDHFIGFTASQSVIQVFLNKSLLIIYNKSTRCNSYSIVFINNYKYALHVSDALCVHHQEHYKL